MTVARTLTQEILDAADQEGWSVEDALGEVLLYVDKQGLWFEMWDHVSQAMKREPGNYPKTVGAPGTGLAQAPGWVPLTMLLVGVAGLSACLALGGAMAWAAAPVTTRAILGIGMGMEIFIVGVTSFWAGVLAR